MARRCEYGRAMRNTGAQDDTGGTGTVQSVDRAVSILEFLAQHGTLGVTALAKELGVHKSTASRLVAALERRGLVEQVEERGVLVAHRVERRPLRVASRLRGGGAHGDEHRAGELHVGVGLRRGVGRLLRRLVDLPEFAEALGGAREGSSASYLYGSATCAKVNGPSSGGVPPSPALSSGGAAHAAVCSRAGPTTKAPAAACRERERNCLRSISLCVVG